MFKDNINKQKLIYKINMNPQNAPDCRYCAYYWNSRSDMDYRETMYDVEIRKCSGRKIVIPRTWTFKHGCKNFVIIVPKDQLPSLYIYRLIGKHCPMDIPNKIGKNANEQDSQIGTQAKIIFEDHNIDILA